MKRFGISTHLYHEERLQKAHLLEIAANGFEAVEVFATRSHFDYHDAAAIHALQEWLGEAGLDLHSVHAPITDVFANGRGQRNFSTAMRDTDARKATLRRDFGRARHREDHSVLVPRRSPGRACRPASRTG